MPEEYQSQPTPPRPASRWPGLVVMGLTGFAGGVLAVGWLAMHGAGWMGAGWMGRGEWSVGQMMAWHHAAPPPPSAPAPAEASQAALDTRITAAEQRLDRLDLAAAAAAGNAARAEGLLVAFAARRVIERGGQLGYLEDQLKLRFGNAQPRAVATLIATTHAPVTLDLLLARLQAMAPHLAEAERGESLWERARHELSDMLAVRRDSGNGPPTAVRLDHAITCLREGAVDEAIADVRRLPASAPTAAWIADAQRYAEAQRALDLIETTALLEPRTLADAGGRKVNQPSPLAPPATPAR